MSAGTKPTVDPTKVDAVVLVGGKGTRLRPLTLSAPKPMLPTAGLPFLTHLLSRIAATGIEHVVLGTSYKAETFEAEFGDGSKLGLQIDYVTEETPLGTGGGIANVVPKLRNDTVMVFNGDVLSGMNLGAMLATHAEREAEERARALVGALQASGWDAARVGEITDDPAIAAILRFAAREVVPRLAGTAREIDQVLAALEGRYIAAGPSGSPLRGLVNVLPTGRNFYSVDPKAMPSRLAWETGVAMADSLLQRYLADYGQWPRSVGLSAWGTSAMRTSGDDIAEVLALLGVRPVWDEASRRVIDLEVIPLTELGRPRIDVTVRISGFFRDAFPHVVTMIDDAVRLVAALDEPDESNYVRAHVQADLADNGDERRATTRIFGSKPGTYGAGLLQLIDSRNWRDDADLAEVYTAWGGFAYGRGLDGRPAADDMRNQYRRITIAAKNTDCREHDIADSDDYFQYHGGMVATVRALTGQAPAAYIGDNTRPDAVRTRTLNEETNRVFRSRVVNPRWMAAMRRHGYKGAFEMAATVDYLFGYDATAQVMADWMYEELTAQYVLDPQNRKFLDDSNPWALHGMAERLLEAAGRGMWEKPEPATLDSLRQVLLETEGDLEAR